MPGAVATQRQSRSLWLLVVTAGALTIWGIAAQHADPLPQAIHNEAVAHRPTPASAIAAMQRVWPPLYPLFLWLVLQAGLPLRAANVILFAASLGAFAAAARRIAPRCAPWITALYALGAFHVANLSQLVSESLLIPLALLFLPALGAYRRNPSARRLAILCGVAALACLTRYFALFWLVPIGALAVARSARVGRRVLALSAFLAGAIAPVGLWMIDAWVRTGHPTGMDRFSPRGLSEQTTLVGNLGALVRTLARDLLAPWADAAQGPLAPWTAFGFGELAVLMVAGVALAWLAFAAREGSGDPRSPTRAGQRDVRDLAAAYLVALLVLWTVGNNDPIHSRFVYPVYPLFFLAFAGIAERAREPRMAASARLAALVAGALLTGVQLAAIAVRIGGDQQTLW